MVSIEDFRQMNGISSSCNDPQMKESVAWKIAGETIFSYPSIHMASSVARAQTDKYSQQRCSRTLPFYAVDFLQMPLSGLPLLGAHPGIPYLPGPQTVTPQTPLCSYTNQGWRTWSAGAGVHRGDSRLQTPFPLDFCLLSILDSRILFPPALRDLFIQFKNFHVVRQLGGQ